MKHVAWLLTTFAALLPVVGIARIGFGLDPTFGEIAYVWVMVVVCLVLDRVFYPPELTTPNGE